MCLPAVGNGIEEPGEMLGFKMPTDFYSLVGVVELWLRRVSVVRLRVCVYGRQQSRLREDSALESFNEYFTEVGDVQDLGRGWWWGRGFAPELDWVIFGVGESGYEIFQCGAVNLGVSKLVMTY